MSEYTRTYHKLDGASERLRVSVRTAVLFAFIFLLPTQLGKHFFLPFSLIDGVRVDYLAPAILVTDILAGVLILLHVRTVLHFFRNIRVQALLFVCALLILPARSPETALYAYVKIVEFAALFAVFRYRSVADNVVIFYGFCAGAMLEFALAISQMMLKHTIQGPFYYLGERAINLSMAGIAKASLDGVELLRPYGTFSHPNSMAGFYVLLYAFYLVAEHVRIPRIVRSMFLTVCALIVLFSFSKIALAAFIIVHVMYVVYKWETFRECWICLGARIAIALVVCMLFLPARTDPLTIDKRVGLAQNAVSIILTHPLTGTGLGNYLIVQNDYKNPYPYFFAQPVHNIFLLAIAQAGIPVSAFIAYVIVGARRHIRYLYVAPFIITTVIFTGMFDHYWLTIQQNFLLIAVIFALM